MTPTPALARIGQISMNARDLARAEAFYRDTLGLKHLFTIPPRMAFFDCAGVRLMLSLPEGPEQDHPGSILYFASSDVAADHSALERRGVRFETKPHAIGRTAAAEVWMAFFRDSEGNLLALMQERAL